ncbi:diguanylate cyclase [Pseudoxanthomonas wuyuanensis]|uniref:diguanylate cyclase n=1 Tax=Pseudoxanthomonas wuyuanensis TaxID=1073196 RepID=A0A286DGF0_9GAMM|nr:diguanylate cyclase [Pseudoxanthomonas wuyuanensis]KAF1719716.1 diguanylate cyclase response regulator [Pseudoxanthomonas wuyuanensis]SOD57654.1 response regulator receiver modulated diguanylate cyclase [Pseudoxanthomonas wuyuanensis]
MFRAPSAPIGGGEPLPQRVLLVENSRAYTQLVAGAIREKLGLPVTVAATLAEARELLQARDDWFMALTCLVLADADRDGVLDFFLARGLPTVVVSGVYDEALRQQVLRRHIVDYVLKSTPGSIDYLVWLVQRLERNRRIAALVVDDSRSARTHAAALLGMWGFRVVEAADGEAGLAALEADPAIRLAVVDQEMPGMKGVEFTRRLRTRHARDHLAIIGLSGTQNASLIPQFLKSGANDFLHKPFSREEFFCRVSQNIDQLELIGTLQDLATRDFLTGLPNRRCFLQQSEELLPAMQQGAAVTAALIDIDHFKRINDTWGHEAGDHALRALAGVISRHVEEDHLAARFGGEEFCLLVPGLSESAASDYFERLRRAVQELRVEIPGSQVTLQMTVSIGVYRSDDAGASLSRLLGEADRRLYLAKAGGRNRVNSDGQATAPTGRPLALACAGESAPPLPVSARG